LVVVVRCGTVRRRQVEAFLEPVESGLAFVVERRRKDRVPAAEPVDHRPSRRVLRH